MSALDLFKVAEIELVYRSSVPASERPKVTSSKDAYYLFLQTWNQDKIDYLEEAKLLLLNRGARALGIYTLSTGGTAGTIMDIKQVYVAALKANAHSIIISRNHPSGNITPSEADIRLTKELGQAGKVLGIPLLDHIIVTSQGYYSFTDNVRLNF